MKETIRIGAALAAALLLAGCAKKEDAAAPEPAASAPVEMTAPEASPVESAPMEATPMAEEGAMDLTTTTDEAAVAAGDEIERAGGDRVAQ